MTNFDHYESCGICHRHPCACWPGGINWAPGISWAPDYKSRPLDAAHPMFTGGKSWQGILRSVPTGNPFKRIEAIAEELDKLKEAIEIFLAAKTGDYAQCRECGRHPGTPKSEDCPVCQLREAIPPGNCLAGVVYSGGPNPPDPCGQCPACVAAGQH